VNAIKNVTKKNVVGMNFSYN